MTATYDCIATTTLSSTASDVTFSSISGSFTDLILIMDAILTTSESGMRMQFNSDTGNNYSFTYILGDGSSASSGRASSVNRIDMNYVNTERSTGICHIFNYANTTTNKTIVSRFNPTSILTGAYVGLWRDTGAITSLKLFFASSSFASGSTFALYGVKAE